MGKKKDRRDKKKGKKRCKNCLPHDGGDGRYLINRYNFGMGLQHTSPIIQEQNVANALMVFNQQHQTKYDDIIAINQQIRNKMDGLAQEQLNRHNIFQGKMQEEMKNIGVQNQAIYTNTNVQLSDAHKKIGDLEEKFDLYSHASEHNRKRGEERLHSRLINTEDRIQQHQGENYEKITGLIEPLLYKARVGRPGMNDPNPNDVRNELFSKAQNIIDHDREQREHIRNAMAQQGAAFTPLRPRQLEKELEGEEM
jgi:hypothetical protein